MKHTRNKTRGFTIIEVLIALTIFSIAVAGIVTVSVQGGVNITNVRNRTIAKYLAEEGIELMRGVRDTNVVASTVPATGWGNFITLVTSTANCTSSPCDVDATVPGSIITCTTTCPVLAYNESTGYYNHQPIGGSTSNRVSPFTRNLVITSVSSDEIEVVSTVSWREGNNQQSIIMRESMFNWYGL